MKKFIVFMLAVCLLSASSYAEWYVIRDIDKDPNHVLYGNLSQNSQAFINLVGAPMAAAACGPVAVTNSYRYLENKYPGVYDNSLTSGNLLQTAANLCTLMGTTPGVGTYWDDLIWYKMKDIESKVPGKTVYEAQRNPAWAWGIWDDPLAKEPSWVTPVLPTWQFIWNELYNCEDIEILLSWSDGGHFLTVKSFHWGDVNGDNVIDWGENATFDYIDPCTGLPGVSKIWQSYLGSILETDYNAYGPTITMAVSESIPEPATMILLAAGLLGIRRMKK